MSWTAGHVPESTMVPILVVLNGTEVAHYAEVPTIESWFDAIVTSPRGELYFYDSNRQPVYRGTYLRNIDRRDVEAFYSGLKRVFVVEKRGVPVDSTGYCVLALASITTAQAWKEVLPIPRYETERAVPYISIEHLETLLDQKAGIDAIEALVRRAREGCP